VLAAATRPDVNGLKRLPERQLLLQIRRFPYAHRMTGVRQLNVAAAICYVPFAQIAAIRRRRGERVKSTESVSKNSAKFVTDRAERGSS